MPNLSHLQSSIYNAHFNDEMIEASRLIIPFGLTGEQRLNIYRNNTFITLIDALSTTFPVIKKLVGEDFFNYTAGEFIKISPPRQGPLFEFGDKFADFIEDFAAASSLPYLCHVARLEWALNIAYHAMDATALKTRDLMKISENDLAKICFKFHPSYQIISSEFPIDKIWFANQPDAVMDEIDLNNRADVLIIRAQDNVNIHVLDPALLNFLSSLKDGHNVEHAYMNALTLDQDFNPSKIMIDLLGFGIFVGLTLIRILE
ncbi:MAG: putative DNA-binding domain-containing protein [Emcibacteraceae bacterium]|nr:putative DNA-binding domain-containing protein [Emcibacteraceae bacterium]